MIYLKGTVAHYAYLKLYKSPLLIADIIKGAVSGIR